MTRVLTVSMICASCLIDANDVRLDGTIDSDNYGPYDFKVSGRALLRLAPRTCEQFN